MDTRNHGVRLPTYDNHEAHEDRHTGPSHVGPPWSRCVQAGAPAADLTRRPGRAAAPRDAARRIDKATADRRRVGIGLADPPRGFPRGLAMPAHRSARPARPSRAACGLRALRAAFARCVPFVNLVVPFVRQDCRVIGRFLHVTPREATSSRRTGGSRTCPHARGEWPLPGGAPPTGPSCSAGASRPESAPCRSSRSPRRRPGRRAGRWPVP